MREAKEEMKKKAKELQAARTAATKGKVFKGQMAGFGGFGGGGRDSTVPVANDVTVIDPTPPKPSYPTR